MDLNDYIPALRYGAEIPTNANDITLSEGSILVGNSSSNAAGVKLSGDARMASTGSMTFNYTGTLAQGLPFIATNASVGTIALWQGTGTVSLLAGSTIGGRTAYITGFSVRNISGTTLVGAGSIYIEDTAGTIIWAFPITQATAYNTVTASGTPGVEAISTTLAGAAGKGVVIGTSGSITSDGTLAVSIWGILK